MSALWDRTQLHLALVLLQSMFAGYQIISRVALNDGLSVLIFCLYRDSIALALLIPVAIVLEGKSRPPLNGKLLGRFFVLGFLGVFGTPSLFLLGVGFCSAAFAAAFQNIIPVATFIVAAASGVEQVNFHRSDGKAKVGGTVLCVIGALTMSLYKGPAFWNNPQFELGAQYASSTWMLTTWEGSLYGQLGAAFGFGSWQIGVVLLTLAAFTWGFYLTIQVPVQKEYPAPNTIMAFTYFFGALQLAVAALFFERDISRWKLEWGPGIAGIGYSAIFASFLAFTLQAWCVKAGGPLLTAAYIPLQSIIVVTLAITLLGDPLYLGSIVGGIVVVLGLYLVTWGRGEAVRLKVAHLLTEDDDVKKPRCLRIESGDLTAQLLQEVRAFTALKCIANPSSF